MSVERLAPEGIDAVASWIAHRNADPETHVAYAAATAEAVAQEIRDFEPQGPSGFVVERAGGAPVAVMGVESDAQLKRAWLWGPWADEADWDSAADRIFAAALGIVPQGIEEIEVAADARSKRMAAFADRHGFRSFTAGSRLLSLTRDAAAPILSQADDSGVAPLDAALFEPFRKLHEACFPDRYYEASQLRDLVGERKIILAVAEESDLLGFAFAQATPPPGEPILDFLGVAENARGRGLGERILRQTLRWMFSFPDIERMGLTVPNDNRPATALYDKLGFTVDRIAVGWRRPLKRSD